MMQPLRQSKVCKEICFSKNALILHKVESVLSSWLKILKKYKKTNINLMLVYDLKRGYLGSLLIL